MTTLMPLEKGSGDRYAQLRDPITVVVNFDEEGFELEEYDVAVDDTVRFTNQSSSSLTVYILSEDGQSAATQLLSLTQSQVQVGSSSFVDREVGGTGTFLFSLAPAPQDPPSGFSGTTIVIIVSS